MGKDRTTITNSLRLLTLPPSVRRHLSEGKLSAGHARALLAISDPLRAGELARRAISERWSVREVEKRAGSDAGKGRRSSKTRSPADPHIAAIERALEEALSTRIAIARTRGGSGTIEIPFSGDEELERLFALLTGREITDVLS